MISIDRKYEKGKQTKMGKITVETCEIEGLKVITPTVFGDARGYFMETYNYNDYSNGHRTWSYYPGTRGYIDHGNGLKEWIC